MHRQPLRLAFRLHAWMVEGKEEGGRRERRSSHCYIHPRQHQNHSRCFHSEPSNGPEKKTEIGFGVEGSSSECEGYIFGDRIRELNVHDFVVRRRGGAAAGPAACRGGGGRCWSGGRGDWGAGGRSRGRYLDSIAEGAQASETAHSLRCSGRRQLALGSACLIRRQ